MNTHDPIQLIAELESLVAQARCDKSPLKPALEAALEAFTEMAPVKFCNCCCKFFEKKEMGSEDCLKCEGRGREYFNSAEIDWKSRNF